MQALLLTGEESSAYNDTDSPARVAPVDLDVSIDDGTLRLTMPPHSFATVELALG